MSVPQAIRDRMARAGGGPAGQAEGVAIAQEMLDEFKDQVGHGGRARHGGSW